MTRAQRRKIAALLQEVFEDVAAQRAWYEQPDVAFEGETPRRVANRDHAGARRVIAGLELMRDSKRLEAAIHLPATDTEAA